MDWMPRYRSHGPFAAALLTRSMSSLPYRPLVLAAALVVALCATIVLWPEQETLPCTTCNVVLISMDTVRADHLGVYGHDRATSPNVDRFAGQAAVFENAISQSAWTLPAHGSMMTGLPPGRLGVTHYPVKRRLPDTPTLAEQLRGAGYATAGFTGGGLVGSHFGFGRGFDTYESRGTRFEHNMDEALSWLDHHGEEKFFLFLHGYDAHRPYFSTAKDKEAVGLTGAVPVERRGYCTPKNRRRPADLDVIVQYYDAAIRHGDREVGRFLDALDARGLSDRTIVLITSDHGEEFFEHGNCDHVRFLYREVVSVPFLLRVPGHASAGARIADLIPASTSVGKTLLELVGVDASSFPGESLVPTLEGTRGLFPNVYSETASPLGMLGSRGGTVAMTTADRKLVSYPDEGTNEGYDTIHDVDEHDVLPQSDRIYDEVEALAAWDRSIEPLPVPNSQPRGDAEKLPDDVKKKLEALGYVE